VLSIGEETVRKHVQTILHAFEVPSRRVFGRVYRGGEAQERAEQGVSEPDGNGGPETSAAGGGLRPPQRGGVGGQKITRGGGRQALQVV